MEVSTQEWEVGALYDVRFIMDKGAGPYLYSAKMIYLGAAYQGADQQFSLRPLAGTQSLPTKSIKDMTMLESAREVNRKYNGVRGNPPVKQAVRIRRWRGEV
jgi:hypothetical protein